MRADILLRLLVLRLGEAALAAAVLVGVVLQVALAGLVAHRAVDRVVDEQELHDRLLVGDGLGAIGVDDHAFGRRLLAGGDKLRERLELARLRVRRPDLAEADAAVGHHGETGVVAVVRDLDLVVEGCLQDGLAGLEGVLLAVDRELWHGRRNVAEAPAAVARPAQPPDAPAGSVASRTLMRPSSHEIA